MPNDDDFDDLEAFFLAAENEDPHALDAAAENVRKAPMSRVENKASNERQSSSAAAYANTPLPDIPAGFHKRPTKKTLREPDKFVAVEPDAAQAAKTPFVLIPENIAGTLPWWGWTAIAFAVLCVFVAIMLMPEAHLSSLTARLGDNSRESQAAMRQLILRGDDRTVEKLFGIAATQNNDIETRLRAVDTLSLIRDPAAERALLRLELASGTDARVRQHAIAARRQRDSSAKRIAE